MKAIVLLAFIGSALGALVPLNPGLYPNFGNQRRVEFPAQLQRLDVTPLVGYPPQQYIMYNVPQVNTAVRTIPTAVFADGRPTIAHLPSTFNYFGTPVYDFRFPFSPIFPPGSIPSTPGYFPSPEIPQLPNDPSDDDGIEKLDEKVQPEYDPLGETAGAASSEETAGENDTVSVESA